MKFMTKRNSRRRGGRKNRKQSAWLKWTILGVVTSLALAVAIFVADTITGIETADADFCYERPDRQVHAVSLDNSLRKLSPPQLRDYRAGFARTYKRAEPNSRILIFTTAADIQSSLVRPAFTICKPPATVREQASIGAPSKPATYLARRASEAKAAYNKAVDNILTDAQDPDKISGDSPILEQLQSISRYDGFEASSRSLTVITDGIQNSEIARFCAVKGAMPPFTKFKRTAAYRTIAPNTFTGTAVSVLLVEATKLPQSGLQYCSNAELRNWWPDYFKGNGADSVELTRLRHWAGS